MLVVSPQIGAMSLNFGGVAIHLTYICRTKNWEWELELGSQGACRPLLLSNFGLETWKCSMETTAKSKVIHTYTCWSRVVFFPTLF